MEVAVRIAIAIAMVAIASCADAQNLIVNGSFEEPAISSFTFLVVPGIPGWTLVSGPGIEIQNSIAGTAFDGDQLVELDSTGNSEIAQTIATTPGQRYVLGFVYSPRPGQPASTNGIEVRIGGNLVATLVRDGTPNVDTVWSAQNIAFVAAGTSTTIDFRAVGTSDGLGGYIDDVTVTAAADVPTLSLASLAALMLVVAFAAAHALRRARAP